MKLDLLFSLSYQPISCLISDEKYLMRIRVTCEMAAWLKQSTQTTPDINCTTDSVTDAHRNAIESLIISALFSSFVAFILAINELFKSLQ